MIVDGNTFQALSLVVFLVLVLFFYEVVRSGKNDLEFWQVFATRSDRDNRYYIDHDKIGQLVGLGFSTWVVVYLALHDGLGDGWASVALFGTWLAYCSAMAAFSKVVRGFIKSRWGGGTSTPSSPPMPRPDGDRK